MTQPRTHGPTHELLTAAGQSLATDPTDNVTLLPLNLTPQSSPLYRYVYASYIDEPVVRKAAGTGGTIHYYHRNQQYSITATTTSTGAVAERYAYTAYGQPTIASASGSVLMSSAVGNRYTYTGREWDETLGLHHFRTRWMSPLAGRFMGRDPIGYHDGMSTYSCYFYLAGMDPTGLKMRDCTITKDSLKISLFNQNERDQQTVRYYRLIGLQTLSGVYSSMFPCLNWMGVTGAPPGSAWNW